MPYNEPLFDRHGRTSAFILDGRRIVSPQGKSLAWIRDSSVYDYVGRHIGWWEGDHLRDSRGAIMLWKRGATTGLIHPIPQIPPIPAIAQIEPIRPIPQIPPFKPLRRLAWSDTSLL